MGVQDHSRRNQQDLAISAAAPVVRDESKPTDAAVALETRSSSSESQDEKLQDRQKGLDNLEKGAIPPPYTASDTAVIAPPLIGSSPSY